MKIDSTTKAKIIKKISEIISESPIDSDLIHASKTLNWVKVLEPEADDALQIAAYGHDIERGITKITNKDLKDMSNYEKDREEHSLRSVNYLSEILEEFGCSKEFVKKVSHLVELHEVGGDDASDILKNADSIAYFEYNIPFYLERMGLEKTKFKIKYMFDRVSSPVAREIILNLNYENPEIKKLINELLG